MIDTIREYLSEEFECDVNVDQAAGSGDRRLTFSFHGTTYTVIVSGVLLADPPKDLIAFLTEPEDTLADVVMMAEGVPVLVDSTGFRILDNAR